MTNDNLALQAIIRYDDGREIRVFNVRNKRCCVFIQNDNVNISGCYVNVS